ncbi:metal-sulfur cluster assembly factor [Candidatus Marsarchaeota archaeon]|nr:metal-sulfur cluster assembly factor [Candidatus Marsarchaeota archaeon]
MVDVKEVVAVLTECKDPELDISIVDLGLIYGIEIKEKNLKVTLTMTSPMCPVISIILADAELRLKKIEGIENVEMNLVWEPAWSPDMMSNTANYLYM